MHRKVDPATLLLAVLAVAIAPLTTTGPWDKMDTIVAGVVGVVLVAFTWPRTAMLEAGRGLPAHDRWTLAAQSTVYGFVFAVGVAWLVQLPLDPRTDCRYEARRVTRLECLDRADDLYAAATYIALGFGVVMAVALFFLLERQVNLLEQVAASGRVTDADRDAESPAP
jgi:hypothetical protein